MSALPAAAVDPPPVTAAPITPQFLPSIPSKTTLLSDSANLRHEAEHTTHPELSVGHLPPTKLNKVPAPVLKLSIPKLPSFTRSNSLSAHWKVPSFSEDALSGVGVVAGVTSATHDQVVLEESGLGAGYFSPPDSPVERTQKTQASPKSPSASLSARLRMVKERRSLQTLLIPSFLQSLQSSPQSSSRSKNETVAEPLAGPSKLYGRSFGDAQAAPPQTREKRTSFMSRRRSQTYTGTISRMDILPPALPLVTGEESERAGSGGRVSPPSGLLDEDPFALSPTATTSFTFPVRHSFRTPPSSPPLSRAASCVSLVSTVASDASFSMPGTPTLMSPTHTFTTLGPVIEETPANTEAASNSSPTSETVVPVPAPPPPTPASPLNPNAASAMSSTSALSAPSFQVAASSSSSHHHSLPPSFTRRTSSLLPAPIISTRARPAHTRPAFAPRPSLPSLDTLARMHMTGLTFPVREIARKRKGRVGAGLPAEPWDLLNESPSSANEDEEEDEDEDDEETGEEDEDEVHSGYEDDALEQEVQSQGRVMRRARSKTMGEVSMTSFPSRDSFIADQASRNDINSKTNETQPFDSGPDQFPTQGSEVTVDGRDCMQDANEAEGVELEAENTSSHAYSRTESDADTLRVLEIELEEATGATPENEQPCENTGDVRVSDGVQTNADSVDHVLEYNKFGEEGETAVDHPRATLPNGDATEDESRQTQSNEDVMDAASTAGHERSGEFVSALTEAPLSGPVKSQNREACLESEVELTLAPGPALAIPIPRRLSASSMPGPLSVGAASAIPKYLLRELGATSPARNSLGLTASPTPSRATLTPSPLGSVDMGFELASSPRFAKHDVRRPDSVMVDPTFQCRVSEAGEQEDGQEEYLEPDLYRPDHLDPSTPSDLYTYLDRNSSSPRHTSDNSSVSDIGPFDLENWPLPVTVGREWEPDRARDSGEEGWGGATHALPAIPSRIVSRAPSPPAFLATSLFSYSQEQEYEYEYERGSQTLAQDSQSAPSCASTTASSPIISRVDDEESSELSTSTQVIQYRKSDDSTYSTALDFHPAGGGSNGLCSRSGTRGPSSPSSFDDTHDSDLTTYTYVQPQFFDEGEDSSMLPPLSTLPEDDPVFTLTPSGSRERERVGSEYSFEHAIGQYLPPPPSRVLSRQPSATTSASASPSMSFKSNLSSTHATQLSHSHSRSFSHHKNLSKSSSIVNLSSNAGSRTHSPAASLSFSPSPSTTKSFTNTDSGGSGMFAMAQQSNGRRTHGYGSSVGSTDLSSVISGPLSSSSGSGLAASNTNSISSLRSHASSTFEKSARGRRQSSLAQLSLSSLRTRLVSPTCSSPSLRDSVGSSHILLGIGAGDKEKGREDRLTEDRNQRTYLKYSPAFAAVRREDVSEVALGAEGVEDINTGEKRGIGGSDGGERGGRYAELVEAFQDIVPATAPADANEAPKSSPVTLRRKPSAINKALFPSQSITNLPTDAFEPGSSAGTLRNLVTKQSQTDMHRTLKLSTRGPPPSISEDTRPTHSTKPSASSATGLINRARSSSDGNTRMAGMPATTLARAHTEASNSRGRGGNGHELNGRSVGNYREAGANSGGNGPEREGDSSGSDYGHGFPGRSGGEGRGFGRGQDEGSRERDRKYSVPSPDSTSSESEESESDSETDDYGQNSKGMTGPLSASSPHTLAPPAPLSISTAGRADSTSRPSSPSPVFNQLRNGRKGIFKPPTSANEPAFPSSTTQSSEKSSGEDDVPLARSIPGALQAQKSIRQQIRSLRDRKKKEKEPMLAVPRSTRTSRNPDDASSIQYPVVTQQFERGRSLKARPPISAPLPIAGSGAGAMSSSQEAAMMAQKSLQLSEKLKMCAPPSSLGVAIPRRPRAQTLAGNSGVPAADLAKRLMHVQSREAENAPPPVPAPPRAGHSSRPSVDLVNAAAIASRKDAHTANSPHQHANEQQASTRTLRPMRSFHGTTNPPAAAPIGPPPPPPGISGLGRRATLSKSRPSQEPERVRSSGEDAYALLAHRSATEAHSRAPPVPNLSRSTSPPPRSAHPERSLVQLRVYLNDMQRFNVVEVGTDTNAKEVMALVAQRGEERPSSSWMLYEVCNDFGMERPMRHFELVTDVSGSWDKQKTSNCFLIKRSPFASSLASIPASIPTRCGYVDYEAKKGKWSKRWLELREHGLWLSKKEGKEDEFLCSLSVFDAYIVTRIHKSTRSFTFAVKSTDPITLFENKSDYLHVFSVPEDTGLAWVETIWLARSYIIRQERNVLRNKSAGEGSGAAGLGRSGTRKKPAQTYVSLSQTGPVTHGGPFEPGSLLGNRI